MELQPFDPTFDDCTWTDAWTRVPVIQLVPGEYPGFSIRTWRIDEADVCGQRVRLSHPLDVRGLVTADGRLWMSDVPQERLMMYNNAQASRGDVLVGGLGIGLYPQYAVPHIRTLTIVEQSAALVEVVEPVVRIAADAHRVPVEVITGDVEDVLRGEPVARYDTIFLDTWDTLDAAHLPTVNRLRDLAIPHLSEGGRVLLWGYVWMLRLFEEACERLLQVAPAERYSWLRVMTRQRPAVWTLLMPVVEHFAGQEIGNMDAALAWCRDYATRVTV
ncbi:MAG TPA: class I SAM-dependent methyltransferase [Aggregatilineales bacterium]|nr:class I SAM-dependent methyltransferase [Chloroflexota bacterium]HOA24294.1 class I SAM-dependent methyltransferase [Aggregatilineales bacterium]HPV07266.1 class I SAM-dependent methyltransferase [Aggregatilineales bacterium]HQA69976.1 class I SAM-dependent methyltransferase [Aggregatilineales bacterium]HQE19260.1 class I SAM-dependent methyltransferase [Aggregatilineales bacterium]